MCKLKSSYWTYISIIDYLILLSNQLFPQFTWSVQWVWIKTNFTFLWRDALRAMKPVKAAVHRWWRSPSRFFPQWLFWWGAGSNGSVTSLLPASLLNSSFCSVLMSCQLLLCITLSERHVRTTVPECPSFCVVCRSR